MIILNYVRTIKSKMKCKLIYIFLCAISKIPLQVLYAISKVLLLLNSYTLKYRLKTINQNIAFSFPHLNKKEKNNLLYKFYINFFDVIMEIIKSISFKKLDIINRVKIINLIAIEKSIKKKRPIILMSGHYSNWEWLLLRVSLIKNVNIGAVYKPLSNKFFNQILLNIRTKFGAKLIPLNKWKYFILGNKNKTYIFMFVSDQVPENTKNGIRINFLNRSTLFHKGAEKTANLLNLDVFYTEMMKTHKGYYTLEFKQLCSRNITQEYTTLLEQTIKTMPENWLWSHNRWKR